MISAEELQAIYEWGLLPAILSERETDIVQSYYGFGRKKLTLSQIGRNHSLSPERIRQLRSRALSKLWGALYRGAIWPPSARNPEISDQDLTRVSRQTVIEDFRFWGPVYVQLKKVGINTAHDLANFPAHQLSEIDPSRYWLDELGKKLKKHLDTSDPDGEAPLKLSIVTLDICEPLGTKVCNTLIRNGIRTVEDLTHMSEEELLEIRNIGVTASAAIKSALAKLGLQLASCDC